MQGQNGAQADPALRSPAAGPQAAPEVGDTAALSALEALGGSEAAVAQPDERNAVQQAVGGRRAMPQGNAYAGNWIAKLPNGATVELALQAGGAFRWTATNSGKSNSFEGRYGVENGSLTLTRSDNSQQMAGSITATGSDAFNFKISAAKDAGLNFTRS